MTACLRDSTSNKFTTECPIKYVDTSQIAKAIEGGSERKTGDELKT